MHTKILLEETGKKGKGEGGEMKELQEISSRPRSHRFNLHHIPNCLPTPHVSLRSHRGLPSVREITPTI